MKERLVVIGAGMAAGRLLDHLAEEVPDAFDVTLFNAEPRGTYNRLMLSPVLAGDMAYQDIVTHDAAWYARHGVRCHFGTQVQAIDRRRKVVRSSVGEVPYDRLVLATGALPFVVPLPGHDLTGVIAYRNLEDTAQMIGLAQRWNARAVVIGGGLLGLEAAAGMAARGIRVTVVHKNAYLMDRQLDRAAARLLQNELETRGIEILCGAQSQEILADANGQTRALRLEDGRELTADLIVMAVGIRPNTDLAVAAGLDVGQGVVVSDQMQTSDGSIYALGECVEHDGRLFGLVAPLFDQARVLARSLQGQPDAYVHKELSTKLKVTGCDLFSAGDFHDGVSRECITYLDCKAQTYRRLVLEGNRLIGAVLYGDTQDGGWFYTLIREGADVSALRDTLIFGPGYQPEPSVAGARSPIGQDRHPCPPMEAVA